MTGSRVSASPTPGPVWPPPSLTGHGGEIKLQNGVTLERPFCGNPGRILFLPAILLPASQRTISQRRKEIVKIRLFQLGIPRHMLHMHQEEKMSFHPRTGCFDYFHVYFHCRWINASRVLVSSLKRGRRRKVPSSIVCFGGCPGLALNINPLTFT